MASYPDGGLRSHPVADLTQLVRHAIRRYSADLLLVIAPEAGDPDDTAVALAACAAARQAGIPVVARAEPRARGTWMIDLGVDAATARAIQKSATAAHQSQSEALPRADTAPGPARWPGSTALAGTSAPPRQSTARRSRLRRGLPDRQRAGQQPPSTGNITDFAGDPARAKPVADTPSALCSDLRHTYRIGGASAQCSPVRRAARTRLVPLPGMRAKDGAET